jgi:hypothetical protein
VGRRKPSSRPADGSHRERPGSTTRQGEPDRVVNGGRGQPGPAGGGLDPAAARQARRKARDQQAQVRKIVSEWFVRVRAIYSGRLDPKRNNAAGEQFHDGRRQILTIRDPFALPALTGVLSRGGVSIRLLLVESLERFEQDEATMNLLVMALLDPSSRVRRAAAESLARRKDERVVGALRQALASEKEPTIRRAATALGVIRARAAVPDLINVLSTETLGVVRVSEPVYLDTVLTTFGGSVGYPHGQTVILYQPAAIGCIGPGGIIGTVDEYEVQPVDVNRTEVQEALIAITGRNYGFDRGDWLAWWRDHGRP